jgi:hypothetical protein
VKLAALPVGVSSKNAGNFHLTFDVVCRDDATFRRLRDSGGLTPAAVARAYRIPEAEVLGVIPYEPGRAIKINIKRQRASGDPGETDVFGAQQYAPLLELEIP